MVYIVYGISDCPSCLRACADLMGNDKEYVFINCDFSKTYREQIKKQFNWHTFPIVIRDCGPETLVIGGHDQLTLILNE